MNRYFIDLPGQNLFFQTNYEMLYQCHGMTGVGEYHGYGVKKCWC